MKKSAIAILFLFALGCHAKNIPQPSFQEQPSCTLTRGQIGVSPEKNSLGEIQIITVISNLPAANAGIKEGDVLIKLNNIPIKEADDVLNIMKSIKEETPVPVLLRREGKEISLMVTPKIIHINHTLQAIWEILSRKEKVNLVIVVNEISNTMRALPGEDLEEWKKAMKVNLRSEAENAFVRFFQNVKNCSVLDREMTDQILREIESQQTGLVGGFRKGSNLTGATHLLIIDFSRFPSPPYLYSDTSALRFVEINSGKTIATDQCQSFHGQKPPDIKDCIQSCENSQNLGRIGCSSICAVGGKNYADCYNPCIETTDKNFAQCIDVCKIKYGR